MIWYWQKILAVLVMDIGDVGWQTMWSRRDGLVAWWEDLQGQHRGAFWC
jgi:hypothetical protein